MPVEKTQEIAFALGGLAGNNAHGGGFLQAALDRHLKPGYISCTSGQILWVYRYLQALERKGASLHDLLAHDIEEIEPFHQPDADLICLASQGKPGVFKMASYEIAFDTYKNMLCAFVGMAHNWGKHFYLKEFFDTMPARTMIPLFPDSFFTEISDAFNASDVAILFNSYDPRQGIEFVHLNEAAKERLDLKPGSKKSYRDRTIYKDITPRYVKDGLWIYQYGFEGDFATIDGAYYRQILLSELSQARTIFIARPVSHNWIGEYPKTFLSLEDMKTEIAFNGSYQGERDKILLINKLVGEGTLSRRKYHAIDLIEIEIGIQRSFFDYVFEAMEVFKSAQEQSTRAFRRTLDKESLLEADTV